ncbi:hypothetical protein KYC_07171 [Achromobacter arsenitoxydans SY8]|uniref:Uncharacterized protein n=1 Tax=Achromobacter arsenitoxydans SY8 TaxID=477184 RepID=H0F3T0_9BURK|nr:hypothetical protein KYC_07171 [Achromobacter arsenitoxydans SY8]
MQCSIIQAAGLLAAPGSRNGNVRQAFRPGQADFALAAMAGDDTSYFIRSCIIDGIGPGLRACLPPAAEAESKTDKKAE